MNEADGDRFDTLVEELLDRARDIGLGERPLDLALGVDALVDLDAQMALDERRRLGPGQIVEPRMSPVRAPLRSRIAFEATVVPCSNSTISAASRLCSRISAVSPLTIAVA